ncbi:hypothetical protein [Ochrobactrum sp. AN78]|uniref:hypothetical protein n=1 Tax=Ochrobactrum sp. AN78 TaxID=3039853 RepID=UPI002989AE06|nr:hypothetical protein [Ochrobactrum sp. AN78]MDH7790729.1 hypothetical protein [Ochrobactrum sp. AN78]
MTLSIHLTQDWPLERLAKYGPEITAAMNKLVARFPDELSVRTIADQLLSGEQQLWLILDENEKFQAFATSEIIVSEFTGRKRVMLCELAGDGGTDLVQMIEPFEAWAREIGADEVCFVGRSGWRKAFAKHGYEPFVMRFKKDLNNGR